MPHIHHINKHIFLQFNQCPVMGWYAARADREDIDISQEAVFEQGREVGEKARDLYPGGLRN